MPVLRECKVCHKTFSVVPAKLKQAPAKTCSIECRSKRTQKGNNGSWKGNRVSYSGLHQWVNAHLPKPEFCQSCQIKPPYDLANISQKYERDLTDWEYLCRKCHMLKDGRMSSLRNQ
jgi:hypothetical protein